MEKWIRFISQNCIQFPTIFFTCKLRYNGLQHLTRGYKQALFTLQGCYKVLWQQHYTPAVSLRLVPSSQQSFSPANCVTTRYNTIQHVTSGYKQAVFTLHGCYKVLWQQHSTLAVSLRLVLSSIQSFSPANCVTTGYITLQAVTSKLSFRYKVVTRYFDNNILHRLFPSDLCPVLNNLFLLLIALQHVTTRYNTIQHVTSGYKQAVFTLHGCYKVLWQQHSTLAVSLRLVRSSIQSFSPANCVTTGYITLQAVTSKLSFRYKVVTRYFDNNILHRLFPSDLCPVLNNLFLLLIALQHVTTRYNTIQHVTSGYKQAVFTLHGCYKVLWQQHSTLAVSLRLVRSSIQSFSPANCVTTGYITLQAVTSKLSFRYKVVTRYFDNNILYRLSPSDLCPVLNNLFLLLIALQRVTTRYKRLQASCF